MTNFSILDDYLEPKKGKQIAVSSNRSIIGDRHTAIRTARNYPEVTVKIVSNAADGCALGAMVDYIARIDSEHKKQGFNPISIEDEQGNIFIGSNARKDALTTWQGIPQSGGTRREAFHIIFSMPHGTPPDEVRSAVKTLASVEFKRFQYVMAQHRDTDNPHIHLVVHATPLTGIRRLSPGRRDLARWRETFAENLRALGIDANATPRAARFETRYAKKTSALRHEIREANNHNVEISREAIVLDKTKLAPRIAQVIGEYSSMAAELSKGDDAAKSDAMEIIRYTNSKIQRAKSNEIEMQR